MSYYNRVGKTRTYASRGSCRGFKLNQRRFTVQGLRAKFVYLFRVFSRWRYSCGQALKSVKKSTTKRSTSHIFPRYSSNGRRSLMMVDSSSSSSSKNNSRLRSFTRSNSFYSEAIADCLEFIKRSSISIDDHQKPIIPC